MIRIVFARPSLIAAAAWLIPGAGHLLQGRMQKGAIFAGGRETLQAWAQHTNANGGLEPDERMLVRSGITLIQYWFSVSDAEQERRFQGRLDDPTKRWKLSPMDLESRARWVEYSKAKDAMFAHTDIKQAPWYVVNADNKKRARLNMIAHLLSTVPYLHVPQPRIVIPPRPPAKGYERPPREHTTYVPDHAAGLVGRG